MEATPEFILLGAAWYLVFVISASCHEAAHAFAGFKLGDPTAYYHGQVSLNPAAHIRQEPFGMVLVPVISYALGGWMFGWASAAYSPAWAQQYPKRHALVGLSGPAANLGLMILAGVLVHLGLLAGFFERPDSITFTQVVTTDGSGIARGAAVLVSILFSLNMILMAFNLLPVPPLDGTAWLTFLLPDNMSRRFREAAQQPGFRIFGLIIAWTVFDFIIGPLHSLSLSLLYPGTSWQ